MQAIIRFEIIMLSQQPRLPCYVKSKILESSNSAVWFHGIQQAMLIAHALLSAATCLFKFEMLSDL